MDLHRMGDEPADRKYHTEAAEQRSSEEILDAVDVVVGKGHNFVEVHTDTGELEEVEEEEGEDRIE